CCKRRQCEGICIYMYITVKTYSSSRVQPCFPVPLLRASWLCSVGLGFLHLHGPHHTSPHAFLAEQAQRNEQLRKEVDWCVNQLELGLKTQKPTPKQAEEALRAIRTLRSDKAPLVKKRQLMRAMFGDYRKKMQEELCRELKLMETAAKSARIVELKGSIRKKNGQFIRKCLGACRKSQGSAESHSESHRTLNTGLFNFTTPQEFCFNFF
uniref:Uncharacterized protein n=1 Tax=Catharus ustulatus TaxID=91951 RepID=A0A8C3V1M6_CATUS